MSTDPDAGVSLAAGDRTGAAPPDPFETFRALARRLLAAHTAPAQASFDALGQPGLFGNAGATAPAAPLRAVPRAVHEALAAAACHADPARHAIMYQVLWRAVHGEHDVLDAVTDHDVARLLRLVRDVERECHRMHAFVRFREVKGAPARYVAYFEPAHDVLRRATPFFVARFAGLHWTIATPQLTAHYDDGALAYAAPPPGPLEAPDGAVETLWRAYYASIFNPARLNERLMRREMPARYWARLPEAAAIPALVAAARARTASMIEHVADPLAGLRVPVVAAAAGDFGKEDMPLKARIDACRRCDLWRHATQGVAGRGPGRAKLMLVGEQPGDEEDLAGEPFVGPAGRLLARALEEAVIDPAKVYVTNAVKHFKWEPRGKRRIHKTPAQREVEACHAWLDEEIARVRPRVLVALGATALNALLERKIAIRDARGQALVHPSGARVFATYHPSAALRAPTPELREETYRMLVEDLRAARAASGRAPEPDGPAR